MQGINSKEIKNPKIKNYGKIIESWMLDPKDRNNKDLCKDKNQEVVREKRRDGWIPVKKSKRNLNVKN